MLRTQEEITANWAHNWKQTAPMVSVRCTTFMQEAFIAQCLEGFLIQKTNFPFEVIVHEDASTDKTADIIREYETKYPDIIKPIYETENQYSKQDGSFTRIINAHLTGKYIAMCEGDDYWIDPDKLQRQVDLLEAHKEYSLIFHDAEIINEKGVTPVSSVYPKLEDRNYNATELFQKWTVPTASMVYRKDVLNYPIKNSDNILNGDIFLVEKCAHSGKVHCINKKMSAYRRHPGGVTWDISKKITRLKAYPAHYIELKANFSQIDKKVINKHISNSIINALPYETWNNRFKYIFKSFLYSPRTFLHRIKKWILGIIR